MVRPGARSHGLEIVVLATGHRTTWALRGPLLQLLFGKREPLGEDFCLI